MTSAASGATTSDRKPVSLRSVMIGSDMGTKAAINAAHTDRTFHEVEAATISSRNAIPTVRPTTNPRDATRPTIAKMRP